MTQQDVLDYIRKTPHNSNVNVVKGMLDSLGGGGSSDFSTAEVTITNNRTNDARVECPAVLPNDNLSISTLLLKDGNPITLNAILYKGACYNEIVIMDIVTEELIEPSSVSGGVTYDDEEMTYTITGDCTITLSNVEE